MKHAFLILMPLLLCVSFAKAEIPTTGKAGNQKPLDSLSRSQVNEFIAGRLAQKGNAVFSSRDGHSYGMDSDSIISFEAKGSVVLGEYGYAYQGYRGTYTVDNSGAISVELKGYHAKWPRMKMIQQGNTVRLYAEDGKTGFVFGDRGGSVESSKMKSFWPFRLVDTDHTPPVTPIHTGGTLRTFSSPELPAGFASTLKKIAFRLDFTISPEGKPKVQKYWTPDTFSHEFDPNDIRLQAVKSATDALEKWTFYPFRKDGKAVPYGQYWNFEVSRHEDQFRWIVKDDVITVFDNMPRLREE